MTKSKKIRNGPDLEKHIRKKHRYATYLEASRLFSIPSGTMKSISGEVYKMYIFAHEMPVWHFMREKRHIIT